MADSIRLHLPTPLVAGVELPLPPAQAHYLSVVMRRGVGDAVRVFNAETGEWQARIVHARKANVAVRVEEALRAPAPEPGPVLAFAPLKRDATDLVVQKATELGASALQPVLTERSVATRVNPDRLLAIATEAAEQCERLSVPVLHPPVSLPWFLGAWPTDQRLAVAVERSDAALLAPDPHGGPHGLLIGPEGGFTRLELDLLLTRTFVVPVSLGRLVLRAETAAIAGLARMLGP